MRLLGIDFGTKRIGLAVSDETEIIAREFSVLSPKEFFKRVPAIIEEQQVYKIIVGLPLNMSGQETQKTQEVKVFIEELKKITKKSVETFDERLSSVFAERLPGGRKQTDSLAAQIILQNYLNSRNK